MGSVKSSSKSLDVIKAQILLQAASGKRHVPGLYEALESGVPVPAMLPNRHFPREEMLNDYLVPWLAERVRKGESLDEIQQDYEWCAQEGERVLEFWFEHPQIQQGILAVHHSKLRDVSQHDDEALIAVTHVWEGFHEGWGYNNIYYVYSYPYEPLEPLLLIDALQSAMESLADAGPTLCPDWVCMERPIVLARVIEHLREVTRALEETAEVESTS